MLKTFPGPGFLRSEDGVVWQLLLLVNLYIWLTILSCYGSISLAWVLIGKDDGLSTVLSQLRVCLSAEGARNISWPWLSPLWRWGSLTMAFTGNLYIWLTISSCYGSIPLILGLIGREGGLSTLCHNCGFACQQRVLKTFPGPGYICSEDGVVWLWHWLVNLYIYIYIYIYIYTRHLALPVWKKIRMASVRHVQAEDCNTRLHETLSTL